MFALVNNAKVSRVVSRHHLHVPSLIQQHLPFLELTDTTNPKMKIHSAAVFTLALCAQNASSFSVVPSSSAPRAFFGRYEERSFAAAALFSCTIEEVGEAKTADFRVQFKGEDGAAMSPW